MIIGLATDEFLYAKTMVWQSQSTGTNEQRGERPIVTTHT
jgi:hypothetical protein